MSRKRIAMRNNRQWEGLLQKIEQKKKEKQKLCGVETLSSHFSWKVFVFSLLLLSRLS